MLTESGRNWRGAAPLATSESGDFSGAAKNSAQRILVVDDEPLIRWSVAETLGAAGYEVLEAGDAAQAVRQFLDGAPDVVLLDLQLPDSRDLGLLSLMRSVAPAMPVVLMSAFVTPEVEQDASGLGAAHVLKKPFDLDGLVKLVAILGRDERSHDSGRRR